MTSSPLGYKWNVVQALVWLKAVLSEGPKEGNEAVIVKKKLFFIHRNVKLVLRGNEQKMPIYVKIGLEN